MIGCDVGSQGTNCALYSAEGTLVVSSYQTYDLAYPFPGAAEQDANAWRPAVVAGVRSTGCPAACHASRPPSSHPTIDSWPIRRAWRWRSSRSDGSSTTSTSGRSWSVTHPSHVPNDVPAAIEMDPGM